MEESTQVTIQDYANTWRTYVQDRDQQVKQVTPWKDTRVLVTEKSKDQVIGSTNLLAVTHPTRHNGSEWDYAKQEFLERPDYWIKQYKEGKYIPSKALWQLTKYEANKYSSVISDYLTKI